MKIYKASDRGYFDFGWLKTFHSFSFGSYYNKERMNFGALRVLNDDRVEAGQGFSTHPHKNMEIITIVLKGELAHKDSMGNTSAIKPGEVQVMSAGTGILHSEFNNKKDEAVELLQIWIIPNKMEVTPRYQQIQLTQPKDQFEQILSPNQNDAGVWIHQDAWFFLGKFDAKKTVKHNVKNVQNGLYIFVVDGEIMVEGNILSTRDAITFTDKQEISINTNEQSHILIIEVPMDY